MQNTDVPNKQKRDGKIEHLKFPEKVNSDYSRVLRCHIDVKMVQLRERDCFRVVG
jgi:hypothetical protein